MRCLCDVYAQASPLRSDVSKSLPPGSTQHPRRSLDDRGRSGRRGERAAPIFSAGQQIRIFLHLISPGLIINYNGPTGGRIVNLIESWLSPCTDQRHVVASTAMCGDPRSPPRGSSTLQRAEPNVLNRFENLSNRLMGLAAWVQCEPPGDGRLITRSIHTKNTLLLPRPMPDAGTDV
jgi:hypothetical protein